MVLLTVFGVAQRAVPMRWWSRVLGRMAAPPASWGAERVDHLPARVGSRLEWHVARAVRRAGRALPWSPTCLAEAAAGQVLLRQYRAPGVVVIGLRPVPQPGARWDAHAWLLGRRGALTGGPAATGFTATTVYEVAGGLSAAAVSLAADA
jgi:hypothetical protein